MPNAPESRLRVEVLGPLRAWLDDRELALGPARQRAVFAVLAASANRVVARPELISAVWGESPPATASGSVHTYISGLRRSLEPRRSRWSAADILTSVPAGYSLRLSESALDVANFTRLRADAQQRLAAGDREGAVTALDKALGLWHGEAYSGVPGPFAEQESRRLAEMRLATIEQHARILLELGGHGELVAELGGLVHDHPLHEALHELLMLALYRSGRQAEALEAYRAARDTLVNELGVEPGEPLRRLHQQILTGSAEQAPKQPAAARPAVARPTGPAVSPLSIVPTQVARAIHEGAIHEESRTRLFVGRSAEVTLLRDLVRDVLAGRGRSVWIEGEPGIGKSELLTVALADAGARGCQLAWSVADELGQHFPLLVIMECLGLAATSSDPRKAMLAEQLHGEPAGGGWGETGPAVAAERLLAFVREVCATAPLILVIDDLQWADEASILVWGRLATVTRQLPMLLVAATRPEPNRRELVQLRRAVEARDGHVLALEPLGAPDVESLIGKVVGARPGASLRTLTPRVAGNPLYAREMAHALVRQNAVRVVDGIAEIDLAAADEVPQSLLAAVRGTLQFLSSDTKEVLRVAALLGMEFAVGDIAALTGRTPYELVRTFDEAVAANVVVDADTQLAFRHPFLRQALYDETPKPLRATLRRHTAEVLARTGAPVARVAEQLVAEPVVVDGWVVSWLADNHAAVLMRAPLIAADLLGQALSTDLPTAGQRETLLVALVRVSFRLDRYPEAEARQALTIATDPADRAEMRQLLAVMRYRNGDAEGAITMLADRVDDPSVPEIWRARHRSMVANFRRGDLEDLDQTEDRAHQVHAEAVAEQQPYAAAHALQTLWLVNTIRRDHARALHYVDDALRVVDRHDGLAGLHLDLLDNRVFTLQNLDRLGEADATLKLAEEVAQRRRVPPSLQIATAVQDYWAGRWDKALAELDTVTKDDPAITFHGEREPSAVALLRHGVAALITGRRDDRAAAAAHVDTAEAQFPASSSERESCDFLLVARALAAEQQRKPNEALSILTPILRPSYALLMLRHQWLPEVVRLALDAGEPDVAHEALAICADEEAKETVPARAFAAAARCRALVSNDPEPALVAAKHYRSVGRRLELAATLEDAAVLLARAGRRSEATAAVEEAVGLFTALSAHWDIRRAEGRLRDLGVR